MIQQVGLRAAAAGGHFPCLALSDQQVLAATLKACSCYSQHIDATIAKPRPNRMTQRALVVVGCGTGERGSCAGAACLQRAYSKLTFHT